MLQKRMQQGSDKMATKPPHSRTGSEESPTLPNFPPQPEGKMYDGWYGPANLFDPPAARFDQLPNEIKRLVLEKLPRDDLLSLQKVSTTFYEVAADQIYEKWSLSSKWGSLKRLEKLRHQKRIRMLRFKVESGMNKKGQSYIPDFDRFLEEAKDVMRGLQFLKHLSFSFGLTTDVYTLEQQAVLLRAILSCFDDRTNGHVISSLELRDLPFKDLSFLRDALQQQRPHGSVRTLQRLILNTDNECWDDFQKQSRMCRQLPTLLLHPQRDTLSTLELDFRFNWGWCGALEDFLTVEHFKLLRSLTLRNYAFTSRRQAQWITSHGSTLRVLRLDQCPVVFTHLGELTKLWNSPAAASFALNKDILPWCRPMRKTNPVFNLCWNDIFDEWSALLSKLVVFDVVQHKGKTYDHSSGNLSGCHYHLLQSYSRLVPDDNLRQIARFHLQDAGERLTCGSDSGMIVDKDQQSLTRFRKVINQHRMEQ